MADQLLSPLRHMAVEFAVASSPWVRIAEARHLSQVSVRFDPAGDAIGAVGTAIGVTLPARTNTMTRGNDLRVLQLGPDEWLVVGPPGRQSWIEGAVRRGLGGRFGSVTDVSAQRTTITLSGPMASDLLAGGCALDLDAQIFTGAHCAQTMLAKAPVILHRETRSWVVMVRSSFADYLAQWLVDGTTEYRSAL